MPKKIEILTCTDCPHKGHSGGYGQIMYKPTCQLNHNKHLGFTVDVQANVRSVHQVARYDGAIPTWCPLPEDKGAQLHDALVGLMAASTYQGGPTLDRQSLQRLIEVYNDPA